MGPQVGFIAARPVKWLVLKEPEVMKVVAAFNRDQTNTNYIDVAGPPRLEDVLKYRANPKLGIELPLVRLTMRVTVQPMYGRVVEVTCSDRDMEEIGGWYKAEREKQKAKFGVSKILN